MQPWLDDGDIRLYHGDAAEVLRALPAESVQCCVTSPPYFGLRDYGTATWEGGDSDCDHAPHAAPRESRPASGLTGGKATVDAGTIQRGDCRCGAYRIDSQIGLEPTPDEFVAALVETFREVRRVLRVDGTLWLNLGDSYAGGAATGEPRPGAGRADGRVDDRAQRNRNGVGTISGLKPKDLIGIPWRVAFALQEDGWYLRSDIIWAKPNPMPESVRDRPTRAHEYLFLLSKSPRYFYDADAIREDAINAGAVVSLGPKSLSKGQAAGIKAEPSGNGKADSVTVADSRNKRSVWTVATQPYAEAHFATFPPKLIEPCVLAGCPEGGTVLDPFNGSGTTALVARNYQRRAIGIDLSEDYLRLSAARLQQLSLLA
jgi:DNA modification methylase